MFHGLVQEIIVPRFVTRRKDSFSLKTLKANK